MWGLVGWLEFSHMAHQVNCLVPIRYDRATIEKNWGPGFSQFGLRFQTKTRVYLDDGNGTFLIHVYKIECIQTLYNIYLAVGKADMELKKQIKEMASL